MRRRLVKQGDNALTVTLPSSWIKEKGLSPKDEVDIDVYDGDLIIRTKAKKALKKINLILKSGSQAYIEAMLRNLYINGYDDISIWFGSEEDLLRISKAIEPLIGFEIVTQKEGSCLVKNLSLEEHSDYESIFKKTFYIVFTMQELLEKLINNEQTRLDAEKMAELSKNSSKFSCFARRIIFKSDISKNEEGITKYTIISLVHMIARTYSSIYSQTLISKTAKKNMNNKSVSYLNSANDFFRRLFDAYCSKDLKSIESILKIRESLLKTGIESADSRNFAVIHCLMEIIRLCGTIAGKVGFLNSLENRFEPIAQKV